MKSLTPWLLATFLILGAAAPAWALDPQAEASGPTKAEVDSDFERRVARLERGITGVLSTSDVTQGKVGILAVDAETGAVLYEQGADISMNPASNAKLVTAAATLDQFGPAYTVQTQLLAGGVAPGGRVPGGVIDGGLYVRGGGDAFLLYEDFLGWAAKLHRAGVREINGGLIVDNSLFAGADLPPAFEQKSEDAAYRAPIGALSVNFNGVTLVVEAAKSAGDAPSYHMIPPNKHIRVKNQAKTVAGKRRNIEVISRTVEDGAPASGGENTLGTELVVTGTIGQEALPFQSRRKRIDNPALFAGSVLIEALNSLGITVSGGVKVGEVPAGVTLLVDHESQPLSFVESGMNKWSNNFISEMLLRLMGTAEGEASTWEASVDAVRAFLAKTGIDTEGLVVKNGSGLYDANRASARQMVELLRYMNGHPWAAEFAAALPISGADGTMLRRLEERDSRGKVRAKTGSLNEVTSLSGYIRTAADRQIIFSIIFNDPPKFAWQYRPVQDRIARAIRAFDD